MVMRRGDEGNEGERRREKFSQKGCGESGKNPNTFFCGYFSQLSFFSDSGFIKAEELFEADLRFDHFHRLLVAR